MSRLTEADLTSNPSGKAFTPGFTTRTPSGIAITPGFTTRNPSVKKALRPSVLQTVHKTERPSASGFDKQFFGQSLDLKSMIEAFQTDVKQFKEGLFSQTKHSDWGALSFDKGSFSCFTSGFMLVQYELPPVGA